MAARDYYSINIKCEKCSNSGVVNFSEKDYPFMKSLDTRVESVEGDFEVQLESDSALPGKNSTMVECKKCKNKFKI